VAVCPLVAGTAVPAPAAGAGAAPGPVLMKPFTPDDLAASVLSAREQAHG
jgi:hypothetical protein